MIDSARLANDLLEKDGLDIVTVGRGFQKNPGLILAWADQLGQQIQMPNQVSVQDESVVWIVLT
jgi:2,4-dienoyl-CoA reductase-like NADH-dependent reductase (Old Yellow Enzyme family)